ncbi:MAG TPA: arylesterase [Aquimonas sp.]|nr:arylesterase [Aquimonas sp.]HRF53073.1 arylesterase [Aquimonas sp.]
MPNAASRSCLHHFVNALLWLLIFSIGGGVATLQAQEARRILVLGDSLSAAYGLSSEQGWPALLNQQLKSEPETRHWEVVNASVSGETTAGGSARIEQAISAHAPDIVAVELGANDGLRGLPLDQAERHLARIITLSQAANAKVLLIGMRIPPNYGPEYTAEFEAMFARLADTHGTAFLPFLMAPIATDREAFQADNLHPTAAAQPLLMQHVLTALEPLL